MLIYDIGRKCVARCTIDVVFLFAVYFVHLKVYPLRVINTIYYGFEHFKTQRVTFNELFVS